MLLCWKSLLIIFIRPAKNTAGRPSGGIAVVVNVKSIYSCEVSNDLFIAVDLGSVVISCVYMPTNSRNAVSSRKFALTCASLSKYLHKFKSSNKSLVVFGILTQTLKMMPQPLYGWFRYHYLITCLCFQNLSIFHLCIT